MDAAFQIMQIGFSLPGKSTAIHRSWINCKTTFQYRSLESSIQFYYKYTAKIVHCTWIYCRMYCIQWKTFSEDIGHTAVIAVCTQIAWNGTLLNFLCFAGDTAQSTLHFAVADSFKVCHKSRLSGRVAKNLRACVHHFQWTSRSTEPIIYCSEYYFKA